MPLAPLQQPSQETSHKPRHPRFTWRILLWAILVYFILSYILSFALQPSTYRVTIPYSPTFLSQVSEGNVSSISSKGATIDGNFKVAIRYPNSSSGAATQFETQLPAFANNQTLLSSLQAKGVVIEATNPSSSPSFFVDLLLTFGPLILIFLLFFWFMRRAAGGSVGGLTAFSRSRAQRVEPEAQLVTFADVAGIDEAKEELTQIVDFLKDPSKYLRLGGRIPRGVLLTGPAGCGKTLLAKALSGQAQVPFFSTSASEFIEVLVGVGASRIRDLFSQAKAAAPAIIFIDELDAIGRSRAGVASGLSGVHDEREQTLNQILTEMDGFTGNEGVIVVAATNRPEILDTALVRPGRFDRRVAVQPPDTAGRRKILEVHTRSVPLADDVELGRLAAVTVGMVGADLANVVNEGALMAAERGHNAVQMNDLHDALEKLVLGTERRILLSKTERRRTAYHEAGHAVVSMFTDGADPIRKVSIIPRGMALGVTLSAPGADRFSYDRNYLLGKIKVALGGRCAEEIIFDDVTTGAQNDLKQATDIARRMVGLWGMSDEVGPLSLISDDEPHLMALYPGAEPISETTLEKIDREIKRIIEEAYETVRSLLKEHRDRLDVLAARLLETETLGQDEAYAAVGLESPKLEE